MRTKTIAIDFDGTCVSNEYPRIGRPIGAELILKHIQKTYDVNFLLYTMRTKKPLLEAIEWFGEHGMTLWGVNNNPGQATWSSSPKIYANLYIDDTALGVPLVHCSTKPYVDWDVAGPMLEDWCQANCKVRAIEK